MTSKQSKTCVHPIPKNQTRPANQCYSFLLNPISVLRELLLIAVLFVAPTLWLFIDIETVSASRTIQTLEAASPAVIHPTPQTYPTLEIQPALALPPFSAATSIEFARITETAYTPNSVVLESRRLKTIEQSVTRSMLIQFSADTTSAARKQIIQELGGMLIQWIEPLHLAEIVVDGSIIKQSVAQMRSQRRSGSNLGKTAQKVGATSMDLANDAVVFAEFDVSLRGAFEPSYDPDYLPNDPDLVDPNKSYAPQIVNLTEAWDYTMGNSAIVIAILDTGINTAHPEFDGRLLPGYDFINEDDDPNDDHGHGTHTAGILAAAADNSIGSSGICPYCRLMPVKVLDSHASGNWSSVTRGIVYAVDNGADIINLSLGTMNRSLAIEAAVAYALQHNVLIVAAAGNAATARPFYPAALEHVLAVSATDYNDKIWGLSNYGDYIDVSAPGHVIYSTSHNLNNAYNGYTFLSGTSMAAPHVAGVAALLLAQDDARTPHDLTLLLTVAAEDLGEQGKDEYYGYGRLNAGVALNLGAESQTTPGFSDDLFAALVNRGYHVYMPFISADVP